jgi:hypothetical protein
MTDEQIALARRAVACKGWRWMPGMRAIGRRSMPTAWFRLEEQTASLHGEWADAIPDLQDPATLGCLLALVREALDSPRVHVLYVAGLHRWECADNRVVLGVGATEAEALVAALEEAP